MRQQEPIIVELDQVESERRRSGLQPILIGYGNVPRRPFFHDVIDAYHLVFLQLAAELQIQEMLHRRLVRAGVDAGLIWLDPWIPNKLNVRHYKAGIDAKRKYRPSADLIEFDGTELELFGVYAPVEKCNGFIGDDEFCGAGSCPHDFPIHPPSTWLSETGKAPAWPQCLVVIL